MHLVPLYTHLILLTLGNAFLVTLVAVYLNGEGAPAAQIGLVGAAFYLGMLGASFFADRLIQRLGHVRALVLCSATLAFAAMALTWTSLLPLWLVLRMLAGMAAAVSFVAVESWVLGVAPLHRRSSAMARYMLVYYFSYGISQLFIDAFPSYTQSAFWLAAGLCALALLPLRFARAPALEEEGAAEGAVSSKPPRAERALGLAGCLVAGMLLGGISALMPIQLEQLALGDEVGLYMAWLILCGMAFQLPNGSLADKVGKRTMMGVQTLMVGCGCLLLWESDGINMLIPAFVLVGAGAFTLYPTTMSYACGNMNGRALVRMTQKLMFAYSIGSLTGPAVAGMMLERYQSGLFLFVILLVAGWGIWLLLARLLLDKPVGNAV
ncbi:MFS transporter [Oceanimonas baumannii]|uniref:MFS transporter n=1 Tax=Oceanimonas baumannii TaxID=129578 RepID=A0A235CA95_9GAMM|nr:MFS transporter [Oceanimonas baumannii]OYD21364.1 MFS transporter [Oceanimonas baumannii]TDW55748.1 UMF2 family putative MFS family transporter [Oceanimonas baumannii]